MLNYSTSFTLLLFRTQSFPSPPKDHFQSPSHNEEDPSQCHPIRNFRVPIWEISHSGPQAADQDQLATVLWRIRYVHIQLPKSKPTVHCCPLTPHPPTCSRWQILSSLEDLVR